MQGRQVVIVEGQLRKIIHAEGEGELPQKGQQIFALYRGTLENGVQFDANQDRESPFNFVLGQGRVIKGWDEGFATMKRGERATLICAPDYAYGARGSPPRIPANATLHFEVELLDFKEKKREKWELSDEEKLSEALKLKESGNASLKNGDAATAVSNYKDGIDYVEFQTGADAKDLLKILRLNISQALLKLNKYSEVIDHSSKVLKDDPQNPKALYRRGVAYSRSQDFDRAQVDFKDLLKVDPSNGEAKNELAGIAAKLKQFREKEKKVFGNIFAKGGIYDDVKPQNIQPEVKKIESEDDEQEDEIKSPEQDEPQAPTQEPKVQKAEQPLPPVETESHPKSD